MLLVIAPALAADPAKMTLGEAHAPDGVTATWAVAGCNLMVRVANATPAPIEVDWMRSVWSPAGAATVPLVPGSSSKMSAMISIPPMVVPPGGFAEELLFRKDHLPSDGDGCLFHAPSEATITLAVAGGWLTQGFRFEVDEEAVRAAEEARRRQSYRELPVLDFRLGRVCLEHERRLDGDPCFPNSTTTGAQAAADEVAGRMRFLGCADDEIAVVTDAIMRGPISADPASHAYARCVAGAK